MNKPTAVKEDNNYLKKTKLMMDELNNSYINYLQSNRSDKESIKEAYNNLSYVIPIWYTSLIEIDKNYLLAKSPNIDSLFKVYLAEEGFDFADIEGSYKKMCENKFNEIIEEESPNFDMKAKMYYYKILREVFGSPPDLTSV